MCSYYGEDSKWQIGTHRYTCDSGVVKNYMFQELLLENVPWTKKSIYISLALIPFFFTLLYILNTNHWITRIKYQMDNF